MKLTTMKISVPVLMLMMFQSGYGVSDWFEKAWGLMNQGKKAEAYAIVQEAQPEQVGKLSPGEETKQVQKVWSEYVSDAISQVLPSYYYTNLLTEETEDEIEGNLNEEGEALRDAIINFDEEAGVTGTYKTQLIDNEQRDIDRTSVRDVFLFTIVHNVYFPGFTKQNDDDVPPIMNEGQQSAWLLPDNHLLEAYVAPGNEETTPNPAVDVNKDKGIRAWAGRIAAEWKTSGEDEIHNKNLLKNKEGAGTDPCVIGLRNSIDLTGGGEGSDLGTVYTAIKTEAAAANSIYAGADESEAKTAAKTAAVEALADALRSSLNRVLLNRIKASEQGREDNLDHYLAVKFNRDIIANESETVKPHGTEESTDPLKAILSEAGNITEETDESVIDHAINRVIVDDLAWLLRSDKRRKTTVYDLDKAIITESGTVLPRAVLRTLTTFAEPFDDKTADTVVENLQLIRDNPTVPNEES